MVEAFFTSVLRSQSKKGRKNDDVITSATNDVITTKNDVTPSQNNEKDPKRVNLMGKVAAWWTQCQQQRIFID